MGNRFWYFAANSDGQAAGGFLRGMGGGEISEPAGRRPFYRLAPAAPETMPDDFG